MKGAGLEFADHRAYQPGDDVRRIDPALYARFGQPFVRQYAVQRQLSVTILVDASASMGADGGKRFALVRTAAAVLGFVALAGGDRLRLGMGRERRIEWSAVYTTPSRAADAIAWLSRQHGTGGRFDGCLEAALPEVSPTGLTIVISDWWDAPPRLEALLPRLGAEVWALQVLSREEEDPSLLGAGEAALMDAESGQEMVLTLDAVVQERFRRILQAWQEDLRQKLTAAGGRFLTLGEGASLEETVLRRWRQLELLT
ncbi:DUF58 domain-containing protein [Roseitranquillus sediminis]|uniref:DUF58 domain-containing protein n=1 Tax=Roseitranquillus sediminis TaxID=2809051 RepID=UPI001D0CA981|nr:DUF58 domain-containing protein [Roseitranquillus sediminis]MBM9594487.1 DUF58 domain-containing protein [Roseitranquillus sediminis]